MGAGAFRGGIGSGNPYNYGPGRVIDNLVTLITFKADLVGLEATRRAVRALQTDLNALGKRMIGYGLGATAANFANIAAFAELENAMKKTEALVGINADALKGLRREINGLAADLGKSQAEIARGLYLATSAGLTDLEDAMSAVRAAAVGSEIGLGEIETLTDLLTDAMNAFGAGGLTAEQALDSLTEAVRLGKFMPDELASSLGRVLPFADALGVKFSEVAGMMAAMSRTGTSTDEAATSLRQVMRSLVKPSADAQDAMRELGFTSAQLRDVIMTRGLFQALELLNGAVGDNEDQMARIFPNIRALVGVFDLFGSNVEANRRIMLDMVDSTGEAPKALEIMESRISDKFVDLLAHTQAWAVGIGRAIAPLGHAVLNVLLPPFEAFRHLLNSMNPVLNAFLMLLASFGAITATLGALIIAFNALTLAMAGLNVMKYAIRGIFSGYAGSGAAAAMAGGATVAEMVGQTFARAGGRAAGLQGYAQTIGARAGVMMGMVLGKVMAGYGVYKRGVGLAGKAAAWMADPSTMATQFFAQRAAGWAKSGAARGAGRVGDFINQVTNERYYGPGKGRQGAADAKRAASSMDNLRASLKAQEAAERRSRGERRLPGGGVWYDRGAEGSARWHGTIYAAQQAEYLSRVNRSAIRTRLNQRRARRISRLINRRVENMFKDWHNEATQNAGRRARQWTSRASGRMGGRTGRAAWNAATGFGRRFGLGDWVNRYAGSGPRGAMGKEDWEKLSKQMQKLQWQFVKMGILYPLLASLAIRLALTIKVLTGVIRNNVAIMKAWQATMLLLRGTLKGLTFTLKVFAGTVWFTTRVMFMAAMFAMAKAVWPLIAMLLKLTAVGILAWFSNPITAGIAVAVVLVAAIAGLSALVVKYWENILGWFFQLPFPIQAALEPLVQIVYAMYKIGEAVVYIWQNWDTVKQAISEAAAAAWDFITRTIPYMETIGRFFGWVWEMAKPAYRWVESHYDQRNQRRFGDDYQERLGATQQVDARWQGLPPSVPSYASGGMVPGRSWQSVPAVLHGGEAVLPASLTNALMSGAGGGRSMTVNVRFDDGAIVVNDASDAQVVARAIVGSLEDEVRNLSYAFDSAVDT